jgi:hypothetical protein
MRGRPSAWRRIAVLEARHAQQWPRHPASVWDLDRYGIEELEELTVLAEKAQAAGGAPAWTVAEMAALERLWGKQQETEGGR